MSTITRTQTGLEIPAAGSYTLDPAHTSANFSVRHLGLSKVRGLFADVSGSIVIADVPTESSVSAAIQAASIDTRNEDRDAHLRSADFFDVEQFPLVEFTTASVRQAGSSWKVDGHLTIKGVTQPVELDVEFEGGGEDPWGGQRIVFSATAEIDREDFGLVWNQVLEAGNVLIGKSIKIQLEVQAVRD